MSVINATLQKLDHRGAPRPALGPALAAGAVAPARPARWRLPLIVTLGSAAIAATAFADWPRVLTRDSVVARAVVPVAVAESAQHAAPAPAPAASANNATSSASAAAGRAVTVALAAPAAAAVRPKGAVAAIAPPIDATSALPIPMPMPARIDKRSSAAPATQTAAALHRLATEQAQAGHSRAALERAHEALAADPAYAAARLLAAVLEHETGATQRAVALLREGLALQPKDPAQALLLARLLAHQGETAAALATIDSHQLADASAQGLRGGLLAQTGDYRRALAAYESAARQEPANPLWWFGLGVALESQGDAARARQAYARAQAIGLAPAEIAHYAEQRLRALD